MSRFGLRKWSGFLAVVAGGLFSMVPAARASCNYRCVYVKRAHLYECRAGLVLEDCHAEVSTCWGVSCTASSTGAAPAAGWTALPEELVVEMVGPEVARLLVDIWEYQGDATRLGRPGVPAGTLSGGVVIGGEPRDFTLVLRAEGGVERYELDVEGWGRAEFEVRRMEPRDGPGPVARVSWSVTTREGARRFGTRDVVLTAGEPSEKTYITKTH